MTGWGRFYYNVDMTKQTQSKPSALLAPGVVTVSEAAKILGITPGGVGMTIFRGSLHIVGHVGKSVLLNRAEVEAYRDSRQLSGPRIVQSKPK